MKQAENLKFKDAFVGMEFEANDFSYSKQCNERVIFKVREIRKSKSGKRIKLIIEPNRHWSNGYCSPESPMIEN